ncbi:MAG TPA: methyl-accepting chemotaxis protein, partial [Bacteroidales bacterium]
RVILGLAAILASIVFTWLITFSFTKGINATVKASRQIANGNLEIKIDSYWLDRKDEIGDLLRSFRTMADKLKTVVVSIINSSEIIATAGQQVSSATQQLSQGANEQASAVEEISSSVEQMTSNTHQNAENAHHAEKVASLASTNIQQSNIAIKGSTNSMKAVASKISIIGDIAFQTNLLALNAAVEAARAGEHGRGFAVVAAEVRKLAERSRTATDEINILSKTGVETAENAARQFEEVVPEIDRTTKLVQEISAASGEQSSGINQISTSIQTLNHVTQQNAAASEEMSTSAEELANQAEELKELISYFKVDTNGKGSTHKTKAYFLHASDIKNDGKVVLPVKSGKDIAIQTNELKEHSDKDYEKF